MKTNLRAGDDIVSHCGKCKMDLNHTIHALVDGRPVRVECRTCGAVHSYRVPKSEKGKRARKRSSSRRKKATRRDEGPTPAETYKKLMADVDTSSPQRYSIMETFEEGDVVAHKSFGVGLVTAAKPGHNQVEITFADGPRKLVHGKGR